MRHPKHGGKREGAGAKRLSTEETEIMKVPLPKSIKEAAMARGGAPWVRGLITAALGDIKTGK